VLLVTFCIAEDRLKSAVRIARRFGLQADFPELEAQHRQRTLGMLLRKELWGVASTFVGEDVQLQVSENARPVSCVCLSILLRALRLWTDRQTAARTRVARGLPKSCNLKSVMDWPTDRGPAGPSGVAPWHAGWGACVVLVRQDCRSAAARKASHCYEKRTAGHPVQEVLVRAVLAAGDVALAAELASQFGLAPEAFEIDQAEAAAEEARRAEAFLPLALPERAVCFVCTEDDIPRCWLLFCGIWRPRDPPLVFLEPLDGRAFGSTALSPALWPCWNSEEVRHPGGGATEGNRMSLGKLLVGSYPNDWGFRFLGKETSGDGKDSIAETNQGIVGPIWNAE
jgi:hypothetical protein